MLPMT
ncbi:hypothetical protein LINPERPRIM_LOCUS24170 [Linum perenne]